jgi:cytochrome c-type biogenesis protein CcmH
MAADIEIEKRMVTISEELRCLVCQNESLAGSHAELAQDLRREIRKMIGEGKSDQEILDFMVARYGDFVRYRPPIKPTTWLLWGGPFLLLLGGIGGLVVFLRRRTQDAKAPGLSDEERRRADALLQRVDS